MIIYRFAGSLSVLCLHVLSDLCELVCLCVWMLDEGVKVIWNPRCEKVHRESIVILCRENVYCRQNVWWIPLDLLVDIFFYLDLDCKQPVTSVSIGHTATFFSANAYAALPLIRLMILLKQDFSSVTNQT